MKMPALVAELWAEAHDRRDNGRPAEAHGLYLGIADSLRQMDQTDAPLAQANALSHAAVCQKMLGKYEEAAVGFRIVLDLLDSIETSRLDVSNQGLAELRGVALRDQGTTLHLLGLSQADEDKRLAALAEAKDRILESQEVFQTANNLAGYAMSSVKLARLWYTTSVWPSDFSQACAVLETALETFGYPVGDGLTSPPIEPSTAHGFQILTTLIHRVELRIKMAQIQSSRVARQENYRLATADLDTAMNFLRTIGGEEQFCWRLLQINLLRMELATQLDVHAGRVFAALTELMVSPSFESAAVLQVVREHRLIIGS